MNPFLEIAVILIIATVLGFLGRKLKQPLLIMFLATGILVGPAMLGLIEDYEKIELLANIGIALLLFIVGLKLDLKLIKSTGPVALATGVGQIAFTSLFGFIIALFFGINIMSSAYIAVALTFSSTIIIVKLLSDKKEIDSLHGQIAIGFLIVQDIAAILALVILTTLGTAITENASFHLSAFFIFIKGIALLLLVAFLMKYILPYILNRLADSIELLTLFAVAWAVFLGASSEILGFTKEVGAFLAGISIASTSYRDSIGARLTSLRDFLLLFFFIHLGASLNWGNIGTQIIPSIVFSLFVLIGNPFIVLCIMGIMGFRRRTSFLAGLTVAQISEFSLIVATLGLSLNHITTEVMGLITLVGVITISLSSYMIIYSAQLYNLLSDFLKLFERKKPYQESGVCNSTRCVNASIILVGLGNYGGSIAKCLSKQGKAVIAIDFKPSALKKYISNNLAVIYGDMMDTEIYEQLPLKNAKWFICTVKSKEISMSIINHLKKLGYSGKIALTASNYRQTRDYRQAGAHLILRPFIDAAEQAVESLTNAMDLLPEEINWPIAFLEVKIPPSALSAGKKIKDIQINTVGVNILAIIRSGKVHYNPGPDFRIFPSDRVLLMGQSNNIKEAEKDLINIGQNAINSVGEFQVAEIKIADNSELNGQTISEINFRRRFKLTVVGIKRNQEQIFIIEPEMKIFSGDKLIVIGINSMIEKIKDRKL
jgi:Kef-type K+ transport system membrane component KefB/Trk K+ transport system NAD-binding subunit